MAITTVDDIVSGLANASQVQPYLKTFVAAKAAGSLVSGWTATGLPALGSASPAYTAGSGYTCDKTTAGAMQMSNGATQLWVAKANAFSNVIGTIILYDRLWSCSGMGFALGTYTVTTPGNLPARITDNGLGTEVFVEQFVAAGAASGTLTLNYLNTNTGAASSGVINAVVSAPTAAQLQVIPLAAGDTGIRQVTSAVTSATWTSGSFGITIMKRILEIPIAVTGGSVTVDWASGGLPKIPNDACLQWVFLDSTTTAVTIGGSLKLIDK